MILVFRYWIKKAHTFWCELVGGGYKSLRRIIICDVSWLAHGRRFAGIRHGDDDRKVGLRIFAGSGNRYRHRVVIQEFLPIFRKVELENFCSVVAVLLENSFSASLISLSRFRHVCWLRVTLSVCMPKMTKRQTITNAISSIAVFRDFMWDPFVGLRLWCKRTIPIPWTVAFWCVFVKPLYDAWIKKRTHVSNPFLAKELEC